uniref:Putative toxin-antitoxin system toxin component, PIN family n=1 Tax=Candidatus Kentrum sp. FW TaxID=2126338 RepID=A0A450U0Y4_9GAMM|nr:MAG: putative toxin-antitoxin system toxin component, PIN family [Candidatus Kentron sp. FW]
MIVSGKKHFLSPDPKDNKFIDVAVAGKADYIISGDKRHLLLFGKVEGIPILSVNDFVQMIS